MAKSQVVVSVPRVAFQQLLKNLLEKLSPKKTLLPLAASILEQLSWHSPIDRNPMFASLKSKQAIKSTKQTSSGGGGSSNLSSSTSVKSLMEKGALWTGISEVLEQVYPGCLIEQPARVLVNNLLTVTLLKICEVAAKEKAKDLPKFQQTAWSKQPADVINGITKAATPSPKSDQTTTPSPAKANVVAPSSVANVATDSDKTPADECKALDSLEASEATVPETGADTAITVGNGLLEELVFDNTALGKDTPTNTSFLDDSDNNESPVTSKKDVLGHVPAGLAGNNTQETAAAFLAALAVASTAQDSTEDELDEYGMDEFLEQIPGADDDDDSMMPGAKLVESATMAVVPATPLPLPMNIMDTQSSSDGDGDEVLTEIGDGGGDDELTDALVVAQDKDLKVGDRVQGHYTLNSGNKKYYDATIEKISTGADGIL